MGFGRPDNLRTMLRRFSTIPSKSTSLTVYRDVAPLRRFRKQLLLSERTVGLVPTMGALHDGHLSLVRQAARENTDVIVSVYVNPTQFGVNEDLDKYPRTWTEDMQKLEALNDELSTPTGSTAKTASDSTSGSAHGQITAIFAPTTNVMYPTLPPTSELLGDGSFVTITPLANKLEGASRPVFFRGVATVCTKLFNIVAPDRVYFGQKDIQQTAIIKRMVKDLHMDTDVRIGPTMREPDGLAMSSRNVYLGPRRRAVGLVLYKALRAAENAFSSGKRSRGDILEAAHKVVDSISSTQSNLPPAKRALFGLDYISLADPESLEEVEEVDDSTGAILSGAINMRPLEELQPNEGHGLGSDTVPVRLIDNIILQPSSN